MKMKKISNTLLALAFSAGVVGASGAFAQGGPSTDQPAKENAPAAAPEKKEMPDMMQGGGNNMTGMMGMMDMMTQMNAMMQACTKMMTAAAPPDAEPKKDEQPNKG
jgi:hypothetical protein